MEGLIGSTVCRSVGSCWTHQRSYQRLPRRPAQGRGIKLGRRAVFLSTAWRFGQLRHAKVRWSPLQLLNRIVDTCISFMLPQPLKIVEGVRSPAPVVPCEGATPPPIKLRRAASSRRGGEAGGRGVMLNICVAEVLLRRSSSEVRRSPLQPPREAAQCRSVRA